MCDQGSSCSRVLGGSDVQGSKVSVLGLTTKVIVMLGARFYKERDWQRMLVWHGGLVLLLDLSSTGGSRATPVTTSIPTGQVNPLMGRAPPNHGTMPG